MVVKQATNDADASVLPITEHVLKRQAKRVKEGLLDLLTKRPDEITLTVAQEFVARNVWGRTAWNKLKVTAPAVPRVAAVSEARERNGSVLVRVGLARAMSLVEVFVRQLYEDDWAERYVHAANVLVEVEFARTQFLQRDGFEDALHRWQTARKLPAEKPAPEPFSPESLSLLTNVDYLSWLAWEMPGWRILERRREEDVPAAFRALRSLLLTIPGYHKPQIGPSGEELTHRQTQCEDARLQFDHLCWGFRTTVDLIRRIEETNAVFWTEHWGVFYEDVQRWPLAAESWVLFDRHMDYDPRLVQLITCAKQVGGKFDAIDGLEWISYGARSEFSRYLLSWLKQPLLAKTLSDNLSSHVVTNVHDRIKSPHDCALDLFQSRFRYVDASYSMPNIEYQCKLVLGEVDVACSYLGFTDSDVKTEIAMVFRDKFGFDWPL